MPCQWMPVPLRELVLEVDDDRVADLQPELGPGIVPLNVWTLAVTPLPMSTVASSATIVVSTMFGAGFVSTTSGTSYGLPPEVASA